MKIPEKLKVKFTKWYIKKGYKFGYDKNREAYWICPWYIRPLLIFFSPSVYCFSSLQGAAKKLNEGFKKISISLNDLAYQINKKLADSLDEYAKKVKEREDENENTN